MLGRWRLRIWFAALSRKKYFCACDATCTRPRNKYVFL
jgi:hypothetical protein